MKIQLANNRLMAPVLIDAGKRDMKRLTGLLETNGSSGSRVQFVYGFLHIDESIWYQVEAEHSGSLSWIAHDESMSYQPYALIVMSALWQLPAVWDGVLHQHKGGARQYASDDSIVLTVVDSCVSTLRQLWFVASVVDESAVCHQLQRNMLPATGWVAASRFNQRDLPLPDCCSRIGQCA
jgi:hypothetical protein